jgi:hypothetical protein
MHRMDLTFAVINVLTVHICLGGVDGVSYWEVPKSVSPRMLLSGVRLLSDTGIDGLSAHTGSWC